MRHVLVIAPHHDDETFGCGGTIAKIVSIPDVTVSVGFILDGVSGVPRARSREEALKIRKREAKKAGDSLGISNFYFLDFNDRGFGYSREALHSIIRLIRMCSPDAIWFPHKYDGDTEHKIVHNLVQEAAWMSASPYLPELGNQIPVIKQLLCYEVWTPIQDPQIYVDITETIELKRKAMSCYKSQIEMTSYDIAIEGLNRYRAAMHSRAQYAEAFQVINIPFNIPS